MKKVDKSSAQQVVAEEVKTLGTAGTVNVGPGGEPRASKAKKKEGVESGQPLGMRAVATEAQVEEGPIVNLFDEMLLHIISFLPLPAVLSARSVNKGLEQLISKNALGEYCINLSPEIISNPKVLDAVFQFAVKNNLKVSLKLSDSFGFTSNKVLQQVVDFMKSYDASALRQIDTIAFGAIGSERDAIASNDSKLSQELANLLPEKCPNLTSFTCGDILSDASLTIPEGFKNPIAVICGNISRGASVTLPKDPKNITSFTCKQFDSDYFIFPENKEPSNFVTFTCGDFGTKEGQFMTLPRSLIFVSFENIEDSNISFQEGSSNLASFSCNNVNSKTIITLPKDASNLISCSYGDISNDASIIFPDNPEKVTSVAFGNIGQNVTLTVPNTRFPALKSVTVKEVQSNNIQNLFKTFEEDVQANAKKDIVK